jgi:hypothetical protein
LVFLLLLLDMERIAHIEAASGVDKATAFMPPWTCANDASRDLWVIAPYLP